MGWNADRGNYYTREQAEAVLGTYSASITALNDRLPLALPAPTSLEARGFTPRTFLPDASRIPPRDLRTFYDFLAARLAGEVVEASVAPVSETSPGTASIADGAPDGSREARREARRVERKAARIKAREAR